MSDIVTFFYAAQLDDVQRAKWAALAARVPWSHYMVDPQWAQVESTSGESSSRRPYFFWAERNGEVCLTAVGLRRSIPLLPRSLWEFNKGPTFTDSGVFDEWLVWLCGVLKRDAARLRVGPPMPLDEGGDDVESTLERRGFVRRRMLGTWDTLCVDLQPDEGQIMASFRQGTRYDIKKAMKLGVTVAPDDSVDGLAALCELQLGMRDRAPVAEATSERIAAISSGWLRGGAGGAVLIARLEGRPLAAALVIRYRGTTELRMLPSIRDDRKIPAAHLVLWEAMRWARQSGCTVFDLGGYSLTARPGDALWGVNLFKRGFAPRAQPVKMVAVHELAQSRLLSAGAGAYRHAQARLHGRAIPGLKA